MCGNKLSHALEQFAFFVGIPWKAVPQTSFLFEKNDIKMHTYNLRFGIYKVAQFQQYLISHPPLHFAHNPFSTSVSSSTPTSWWLCNYWRLCLSLPVSRNSHQPPGSLQQFHAPRTWGVHGPQCSRPRRPPVPRGIYCVSTPVEAAAGAVLRSHELAQLPRDLQLFSRLHSALPARLQFRASAVHYRLECTKFLVRIVPKRFDERHFVVPRDVSLLHRRRLELAGRYPSDRWTHEHCANFGKYRIFCIQFPGSHASVLETTLLAMIKITVIPRRIARKVTYLH